jgi:mannosyltransferase PIG-V
MSERALALRAPRVRMVSAALAARREILVWWAASRGLVVGAALAVHWLHAPRGYFGPATFRAPLGILESWDGIWYRHIAQHGYLLLPDHQSDPAFFPLYPLLLKAVHVIGVPIAAGGVLLSTVLFLAALLAFDTLGRELLSPELARRATLLLAVFPTTYVCSMAYPESLVLLAFALAGLFALRRRWLACAAAAAVASLARPEGALIVIPIAGCLAACWRTLDAGERGRGLAAVLSAPAALVSFPLYLGWALHDPFAWSKAERAWGRSFRIDGIVRALSRLGEALARHPWGYRDVVFCALTLALVAAAWRAGVPGPWLVLGVLTVVLPLGSGAFESDARFGVLALPAYWGLAWLCRGRAAFAAVAASSAVLLAAATVTLPLLFP